MEEKKRKPHKPVIMPRMAKQLEQVGEQIKLARLRRNYKATLIAERAGISRATLWKVEKGDPGVAIGVYAKVLYAIGLPDDILLLARDDELGRLIQDAQLLDKGKRK
ncbi:MAG: helix-turn-helix domain-containing protein [Butyrivibrio sp.]|nr:helix-turn-helix domain-containing protein [Butyrivibrio sp.]